MTYLGAFSFQVWTCEFCNNSNEIDVMDEEIPKEQDVTFMLEPALSTTTAGPSGTDESLVIFCIDISGSMSLTSTVSSFYKTAINFLTEQLLESTKPDMFFYIIFLSPR